MMVLDVYVEGDESDANMGWHNHGTASVELARVGWLVHICASKFGTRKIKVSYAC